MTDDEIMTHDEISFTLNRLVPAMKSTFAIDTSYGALEIAPGKLADKIATVARKYYEAELAKLDKQAQRAGQS
jgi:hypothetical protein